MVKKEKQKLTAKDHFQRILDDMPDDSTSEELLREIWFEVSTARGLAQADRGEGISNEEMGKRIRSWSKSSGHRKRRSG